MREIVLAAVVLMGGELYFDTTYYCWSNEGAGVYRCETLGFNRDTVTVYTDDCNGLHAVELAPPKVFPDAFITSVDQPDGTMAYVFNGKAYIDCGMGD